MAAYRLRPDGIIEIVRARKASRLRKALSWLGTALSLSLVPVTGIAIFVSMGVPLSVVAGLAFVATLLLWVFNRGGAAPERSEPVLRLAHAGRRRSVSTVSSAT